MRLTKTRKVNDTRRKFEDNVKNDFSSCINEYKESSQK